MKGRITFSKAINLLLWLVLIYLLAQRCVFNKPSKDVNYQSLEIVDLQGHSIDWANYQGKVIFLNFWASWCGPCMAELPSIASLYNSQKDNERIAFLLVNKESIADAEKIQAKDQYRDLEFYFLKNQGNVDIKAIPLTYIIDKNGKVRQVHEGFGVWNTPWFSSKLEKMATELD